MPARPTFAELEPGANFIARHIGPCESEQQAMLTVVGYPSRSARIEARWRDDAHRQSRRRFVAARAAAERRQQREAADGPRERELGGAAHGGHLSAAGGMVRAE